MNREQLFDAWNLLNKMEGVMTGVDINMMYWQEHLDMAKMASDEMLMDIYAGPDQELTEVSVQRVPLVRYEGSKRIVIGMADVDKESGVFKATVQSDYAEIFTIPGAYSIRDDEPPKYDHALIKSQLRQLANPDMYVNPFKIQGVTEPIPKAGDNTVLKVEPVLAIQADPKNQLYNHRFDLDNHPFFKETPND